MTLTEILSPRDGPRQMWLALVFIVVNLLLLLAAVPEATYSQGGDAALYVGPAQTLITHGVLGQSLDRPDLPLSFAPPLYSIVLAVPLFLLPWKAALLAIVVLQLAMLWYTAAATRLLLPDHLSGWRLLAQAFVALNPNALTTAHLVQSETLFTLLTVLALVALIRLACSGTFRLAAGMGILLALAALTRPVGLYAILAMPLAVPLLAWIQGGNARLIGRALVLGLAVSAFAIALVSPWIARNALLFDRPLFTTNTGYYLSDQYVELLQVGRGYTTQQASQHRYADIDAALKAAGIADLEALSAADRSRAVAEAVMPLILAQPVSAHAKALARSWASLYLSGGASNLKNYLGLAGETPVQFLRTHQWRGLGSAFVDFLRQGHATYLLLVVGTLAWAAALRVLGLLGAIALWRQNERALLLLIVGELLYFTASYLYLGQSRFRVPMEPGLMVLAAAGIAALSGRLRRFRY